MLCILRLTLLVVVFTLCLDVSSASVIGTNRAFTKIRLFRKSNSITSSNTLIQKSDAINRKIRELEGELRLMEPLVEPKIIFEKSKVMINPCICKGVYYSVNELNTMKRLPVIKNDVISTSHAVSTDFCPICLDKYDYDSLKIGNYSSNVDKITHQLIQLVLDTSRNIVLRPVIIAAFVAGVVGIWSMLNQFMLTKYFHQLIYIITESYGAFANVNMPSFASWDVWIQSLLMESQMLWDRLQGTITTASILPAYTGASTSKLLQRWLTSRWFWQQHSIWSVVFNFPLILDLFLVKLGLDGISSLFLALEKQIILSLVSQESAIIEKNILAN